MTDTPKSIDDQEYQIKSMMRRQPQQDRSLKRVELILDTTAKLIVELGLENVNAGLIAEKSGIPVGTIYQFFTDVEAISTEIIIRTKKRIDGRILESLARHAEVTKDLNAAVDEIIDTLIDGFQSEPGATTIMSALAHTRPYQESNRITIERLASFMSVALNVYKPEMSEDQRDMVSRMVFESAYRVFEKILTEPDKKVADKYKHELAIMMKQYLSYYL